MVSPLGDAGADTLLGGAGDEILYGSGGNDTLTGGLGYDQLVGGTGADVFRFDAAGWGCDQIFDFNRAEGDRIDLRGSGVTSTAGFDAFQVVLGNTLPTLGTAQIDVYGVTNLQASDFLFV